MRARWATILLTLALFGASLYGMRFVPRAGLTPTLPAAPGPFSTIKLLTEHRAELGGWSEA